MTYTLVLLRHGESVWNAENLFTGWVDVDLSDKGRAEAIRGGELLRDAGILPDVVHTSLLRRAITTAALSLDVADRHWIPVRRSWRLNERHYGALQGKNKKQTLDEYGEEQFMLWRRSFDTPPPPLDDDSEFSQAHDVRYADLGDELPRSECLKDVIARLLPYWDDRRRPAHRADRAARRPRQQPARHRQAPRRHQRRRHRGAQHPHRDAAGLRARRRPQAHRRGRAVPRPRRGRRGRRRSRQPGSLSKPAVRPARP
jgi:2,3-bisphosphoglycerate-dependent phosphoglycerate mutase